MKLLDREVHFGKGRTVSLYAHWTLFGTMLLAGLTLTYVDADDFVWSGLIGGPLAFIILPPFKVDDRSLPTWKYITKVALLGGFLTGVIAFST